MKISTLIFEFFRESVRSRSGAGIVSLLAVGSLVVGSACAFLVAGGTRMFWLRAHHPELAAPAISQVYTDPTLLLYMWFNLAVLACAFIVPALFGLTAQAAVLGAAGRERRLAALRLIGLSSRQVTGMVVLETGLQAVLGIGLGALVSVLIAPIFSNLSFQDRRVGLTEILLPWWGYAAVAAGLLMLALGAAVAGMQRVRVSPLGVSRRTPPAALRLWRLVAFAVIAGVCLVAMPKLEINGFTFVALFIMGLLLVGILSLNLVSPLVLQLAATLLRGLPGTAHLVACERVATRAKVSWRRIGPIAFFGVLAGSLAASPLGADGLAAALREDHYVFTIAKDVSTGALLTLIFGFTLAATSIFLGQASAAFEDAELARSLRLMGAPRRFLSNVAVREVLGPAVGMSLFGFAFGVLLALGAFGSASPQGLDAPARVLLALSILAVGWAVTLLAVLAAEPLRTRALAAGQRRE